MYEFDPNPQWMISNRLPQYYPQSRPSNEHSPAAPGIPEELFLDPPVSLHQQSFLDVLHGRPCVRDVLPALDEDPWPSGKKLPSWVEDWAWSPAPYVLLYYSYSKAWTWMNVVTGKLRSSPPPFDPDWRWRVACPRGWRRAYCPARVAWFWWNATKKKSQWQMSCSLGIMQATPVPVHKPLSQHATQRAQQKMQRQLSQSPTCPTLPDAPKPPDGPPPLLLGELLEQKVHGRRSCARACLPPARTAKSALVAAGLLPGLLCTQSATETEPASAGLAGAHPAYAEPAGGGLRAEAKAQPPTEGCPETLGEAPATAVLQSAPAWRGKFRGKSHWPDEDHAAELSTEPQPDQLEEPVADSNSESLLEAPEEPEALGGASQFPHWRATSRRVPYPKANSKLLGCMSSRNTRWLTCDEVSEGSGVLFCKRWNDSRSCGSGDVVEPCQYWHMHRCDLMLATGHPCGGAHTRHAHDPEQNGELKLRQGRGGRRSPAAGASWQ